jgi:hypothetical protein
MNYPQITLILPQKLKEKLKKEASKRGYTVKALIVFILRDWIATTRE